MSGYARVVLFGDLEVVFCCALWVNNLFTHYNHSVLILVIRWMEHFSGLPTAWTTLQKTSRPVVAKSLWPHIPPL